MHKIPKEILTLFIQVPPNSPSRQELLACAKERLLDWLLKNKVEELDCSGLHVNLFGFRCKIPSSEIVEIAEVIAKSEVCTVDISGNNLGDYGPLIAANLTAKHSKILGVNFRMNNLREYAPQVAANLTGLYSKVEVVNFSWNDLASYGPQVAANLTGEYSNVWMVNFSENGLGMYGPQVAANLTREHSKVQNVNFSFNSFSSHGPQVAANLIGKYSKIKSVNFSGNRLSPSDALTAANLMGEHSQVHSVDFSHNGCAINDPEMIKKLTGPYSKIIDIKGIELTAQQLKENAVNLLMHYEKISRNSLAGLAFKIQFETLKELLDNKLINLLHCITLLSLVNHRSPVINVLIKALLLHQDLLTLNDILDNKIEELVKRYTNMIAPRYKQEVIQKYISTAPRVDELNISAGIIARVLTFSGKKRKSNEHLAGAEQAAAKAQDQGAVALKKCKPMPI